MDTLAYAYSRSYREFKQKYDEAKSKWIQDRPAPDFTTHDLNGRTVSLSDFRGQYVLARLLGSWCKPCRKRAAELKAIYPELQARGITVCGLSMDEKREQWAAATPRGRHRVDQHGRGETLQGQRHRSRLSREPTPHHVPHRPGRNHCHAKSGNRRPAETATQEVRPEDVAPVGRKCVTSQAHILTDL